MISIRKGLFETNSSSCHVFVYRPENSITVPKTVELRIGQEETMLDIVFNDQYVWFPSSCVDEFLLDLAAIGVENVKCSDSRIVELFEKYKDNKQAQKYSDKNLAHALFDPEVKLTTIEDCFLSDEEIEKRFGKGYDFYAYRLS